MAWWRNAWWIRIDDGSSLRNVRGRRRVWRAARRGAEEAQDRDGVGETHQRRAEEAEGEKCGKDKRERQTRQCIENTWHIVLHLLENSTATATAAAASGAMRLQWLDDAIGAKAIDPE